MDSQINGDTFLPLQNSKLKGFSADGKYHSDRYESLYSLVSNTEKRSLNDILERAFNAAYALIYLSTFTNIFDKTFNIKEMCINSDITYIGGLILRYMQIIPSNIHSYVEERGITSADIGASALPFCSLLNHSCNPNVSRCTTKNHMIIYALVPIEKGSQIYDNYGIHYAIMDKYERDRRLKQFYFNCACPPCKEDWPTYNNLLSYKTLVSNLDNRRKVEKALVKFNSYVSVVSEGNIDGKMHILEDLSEMIQTLVNYVPLPCQELNSITETLKKVFNLTYGIKLELIKLD